MSNVRLFSCFMRLFLFQSSRKCKKFFPRNFSAKYYEIDNYKNTTSSLKKIDEEHAKILAKMEAASAKTGLFRRPMNPLNISFPNKYFIEGYDPEMELSEILKEAPAFYKDNLKVMAKEAMGLFDLEKKELFENCGMLSQGEARKEYCFDNPEALKLWRMACDSDWNQGYSNCELVCSDRKTAIFRGNLSTKIVKDGKSERAGWAGIKLDDRGSFRRKKYFSRWKSFTHLLIKCRGDGRTYKVMLYCPLSMDITWGDTWSYPLHTHGGPYWQYEKIPFSRFFHTVYGRIQDRQYPVDLRLASSIGIVIMDRINGAFALELDYIGVCYDHAHKEKFAYETYTAPICYTIGI